MSQKTLNSANEPFWNKKINRFAKLMDWIEWIWALILLVLINIKLMRMENVSIVLAEGCYTDIGPNSPFYLVIYIKCMMSGRDSERKSWELRGKLQQNSMYLRPLPASSAPANTDAVIPPTFTWNCLSVCRSWTNSVLLKKNDSVQTQH